LNFISEKIAGETNRGDKDREKENYSGFDFYTRRKMDKIREMNTIHIIVEWNIEKIKNEFS